MRIGLIAEAHSAMNLDVRARILHSRRAGNEECALDLESRIIAPLVDRNRGKACLIAGAARSTHHVGTVMLDRLETADRTTKLRSRSRVRNAHVDCHLGNACEGCRIDQPQTQQLWPLEPG